MTDDEVKKYYTDLLIAQYRNKPKARATIELMAEIVISSQIYIETKNAFNLEDAIGVQLDVIGKYQGITRTGNLFDGTFVSLTDDDFRSLISISIVLNYSEANSYEIKQLIFDSFGLDILMFDYGDMRIGYYISTNVGTNQVAQLFVQKDLLPKPTGVGLSSTIYAIDINKFYGMQDYILQDTSNRTPLNNYVAYDMDSPWLDYSDAL